MEARETDQQLVKRAKKGDTRAFDLLVLKYQGRIAALVGRFVQDASDVEDVTQEAFIKAFRALEKFRGDSAFYTWLYRIAVNTAKNHLASKVKEAKDISVDDEAAGELSVLQDFTAPDEEASAEELQRAILHAIEQLPDDLKQAHLENDKVVDKVVLGKSGLSKNERLSMLFKMYLEMEENNA